VEARENSKSLKGYRHNQCHSHERETPGKKNAETEKNTKRRFRNFNKTGRGLVAVGGRGECYKMQRGEVIGKIWWAWGE